MTMTGAESHCIKHCDKHAAKKRAHDSVFVFCRWSASSTGQVSNEFLWQNSKTVIHIQLHSPRNNSKDAVWWVQVFCHIISGMAFIWPLLIVPWFKIAFKFIAQRRSLALHVPESFHSYRDKLKFVFLWFFHWVSVQYQFCIKSHNCFCSSMLVLIQFQ